MDKISKKQRSKNMAAIRSKGNKTTEMEFVKSLRRNKVSGWHRQKKGAYGSPDFLFPQKRLAIFLDGCFWHGCKKHCIMPKSNKSYWNKKIIRNKIRDKKVNTFYKEKGWNIFRIWEHQIIKNSKKIIDKIKKTLQDN